MFNFIKKAAVPGVTADKDDKEKRKRDKKDRKEKQKRERAGMSREELLRLDEVRRSLKIRGRRKDKEKLPSGITADYTADFLASLEQQQLQRSDSPRSYVDGVAPSEGGTQQSDSSETSLNSLTGGGVQRAAGLPPVPPRPPKRGILKAPRLSVTADNLQAVAAHTNGFSDHHPHAPLAASDDDTHASLMRNTLQNELIGYHNLAGGHPHHQNGLNGKPTTSLSNQLLVITSTSASADSLTDTTNSSFATPPFSLSPVGESQGFHRWSRTSNVDDLTLPLPPVRAAPPPPVRELRVPRQPPPRSDFGFSLRRAMALERAADGSVRARAVVFAEPGAHAQHRNDTGLLPGDRLLEVNGTPVGDRQREEVIEMIRASGDYVTLKVQPVPELSELSRRCAEDGAEVHLHDSNIRGGTLRRSGTDRFKRITTAKSEEHLANEKLWLESEKLWLMHRGGFTAAYKETENSQEPGKLKIRLETTGDVLSVDEDDIEKANPPQFDRAEDLASLRHLNESSILHTLRQRYASNLIHTYAGSGTLLVINPMAPLAIYSEKVVSLFKGCKSEDMPPHIYSMAQASYHNMVSTRRDQSLVFIGRSGSGKTTNFRHCVQYLVTAAGANNKVLTPEKLTALWFVLESFGNCKTVMNTNATRFTQIFSLDFDQAGVVASASLQILMLEKTRAVRKIDSETTFHMMYRMLCGVEGHLRKELFLDNLSGNENNQFMTYLQKHEDKQRAQMEFAKVCSSMNVLGINESEQKVIFSVLAAIFHLGCAGVVKAGSAGTRPAQFASPAAAQRAAHLLGTTAEELGRAVFAAGPRTPPSPTPGSDHHHYRNGAAALDAAPDALEAFAASLYAELINCVAHLINRSLAAPTYTVSSILLVDTPGFQNPATCGRQVGASFEDLCHNYLQERLQLLFHHTNLVAPRDRYLQENIDIVYDENENETLINPTPLVNLLDKQAQNTVIRTSQMDLHEADRRGLLWLLDEEAIYPGSSDDSFIERLFTHYGDRDHQLLIRKAPGNNQFIIQHLQGTNPVLYCAKGWLKYSRENPVSRTAITILQESSKEEISNLFVAVRGLGASSFNGSLVGLEGSQSLRRASSIRRTFTAGTAAIKRKSICLQVKFTIDGLIETLRRTKLRFVQCSLPQHNAGLCESNTPLIAAKASGQHEDNLINVPLLRSQIRGAQILDAVRLYKQGFPNFMPLGEFRRRFHLLADDYKISSPVLDERKAVEDMLLALDLEPSSYRVGLSQIFFRTGALSRLESERDDRLCACVTRLQARCRGHLARRRLARRRLQETAVRCIQRNVRRFVAVRDWPWWRLLVRLQPLLDVHRTEQQLRARTEELETIKQKLEKIENERTKLKHENDKLEAKLSEMTADLAEEHSTATLAAERLDAETSERLKLEKELTDVQSKNRELQQASERLEMELLYARSDLNEVHAFGMDFYKTVEKITKGSYGTVYLGQRLHSEQKVVIKQIVVFKGKELLNAQNEVNILKSLHHPNIIKYLDVYAKDDNFFLVMEYASKGTLQEKISVDRPNNFTAQYVMNTFSQILMGLNHIHKKRIIHRDLKCENIFLTGIDGDVVKIGDFGISKQMLHDDKAVTSIGTYNYVAPELCDGKPYDYKTDIWALGCILYELCAMKKMFDGTVKEVVLSIVSGKRKVVNMDVYGKQIQKMINWMLQLNPENRPDTITLMALPDVYPSMYSLGASLGCIHIITSWRNQKRKLHNFLFVGISEEDEEGDGESGGVYKQRYERAVKELEFTRRRLQQQHEDDLEQLVGLKKQLEKKLADAYEEVEEQRQVVGQWKRKVQKLNGEMNDLRLLLEEQNGRNNLLEKKQRKFDSETQMLQDELKKERQAKERLAREKEVCIAEKYSVETALSDTRLELELKEEKLLALQREFDEVTCGGKTEEEVTVLRRQKIDLDRRMKDQEEELDELAGQVQLLEQAKLRLEMTLEQMRKEAKKEAHARDEELEDARCNAQKKVKALEQQLENEHEERTQLLREKHELERRLAAAAESERQDRAGDEVLLHRLKKDVKRTKALLRDTQAQLERQKAETPGKAMIRQLRNQVEDLECARAAAVKAKQSLENELLETQSMLEEANKQKQEAEERVNVLLREKGDLQTQLEENEEELAEVLKKFKGTVQQMSLDQMALQEQVSLVSELEIERNHLKEQLAELTSKLESAESMGDASSNLLVKRSELKVKELESKLELEQTTRSRLEVQITRLKEAVDKAHNDTAQSRVKEQQAQDQIRKLQRQLREIKEELNKSLAKESEVILKKKELEKRCEVLEAESATARTDLRLALKRIEDLQSAIQGDLEDTISDNSDSDPDTYSSDESVNTFMSNHKLSSPKSEKNPIFSDSRRTSGTASRSSTSSNLAKEGSYT